MNKNGMKIKLIYKSYHQHSRLIPDFLVRWRSLSLFEDFNLSNKTRVKVDFFIIHNVIEYNYFSDPDRQKVQKQAETSRNKNKINKNAAGTGRLQLPCALASCMSCKSYAIASYSNFASFFKFSMSKQISAVLPLAC